MAWLKITGFYIQLLDSLYRATLKISLFVRNYPVTCHGIDCITYISLIYRPGIISVIIYCTVIYQV